MGRPQCVYVGHHMELHPKDIMGKPAPYSARDLPGTPVTNAPKFPQTFFEAFPQPQEYEQFTEVHISYH